MLVVGWLGLAAHHGLCLGLANGPAIDLMKVCMMAHSRVTLVSFTVDVDFY